MDQFLVRDDGDDHNTGANATIRYNRVKNLSSNAFFNDPQPPGEHPYTVNSLFGGYPSFGSKQVGREKIFSFLDAVNHDVNNTVDPDMKGSVSISSGHNTHRLALDLDFNIPLSWVRANPNAGQKILGNVQKIISSIISLIVIKLCKFVDDDDKCLHDEWIEKIRIYISKTPMRQKPGSDNHKMGVHAVVAYFPMPPEYCGFLGAKIVKYVVKAIEDSVIKNQRKWPDYIEPISKVLDAAIYKDVINGRGGTNLRLFGVHKVKKCQYCQYWQSCKYALCYCGKQPERRSCYENINSRVPCYKINMSECGKRGRNGKSVNFLSVDESGRMPTVADHSIVMRSEEIEWVLSKKSFFHRMFVSFCCSSGIISEAESGVLKEVKGKDNEHRNTTVTNLAKMIEVIRERKSGNAQTLDPRVDVERIHELSNILSSRYSSMFSIKPNNSVINLEPRSIVKSWILTNTTTLPATHQTIPALTVGAMGQHNCICWLDTKIYEWVPDTPTIVEDGDNEFFGVVHVGSIVTINGLEVEVTANFNVESYLRQGDEVLFERSPTPLSADATTKHVLVYAKKGRTLVHTMINNRQPISVWDCFNVAADTGDNFELIKNQTSLGNAFIDDKVGVTCVVFKWQRDNGNDVMEVISSYEVSQFVGPRIEISYVRSSNRTAYLKLGNGMCFNKRERHGGMWHTGTVVVVKRGVSVGMFPICSCDCDTKRASGFYCKQFNRGENGQPLSDFNNPGFSFESSCEYWKPIDDPDDRATIKSIMLEPTTSARLDEANAHYGPSIFLGGKFDVSDFRKFRNPKSKFIDRKNANHDETRLQIINTRTCRQTADPYLAIPWLDQTKQLNEHRDTPSKMTHAIGSVIMALDRLRMDVLPAVLRNLDQPYTKIRRVATASERTVNFAAQFRQLDRVDMEGGGGLTPQNLFEIYTHIGTAKCIANVDVDLTKTTNRAGFVPNSAVVTPPYNVLKAVKFRRDAEEKKSEKKKESVLQAREAMCDNNNTVDGGSSDDEGGGIDICDPNEAVSEDEEEVGSLDGFIIDDDE